MKVKPDSYAIRVTDNGTGIAPRYYDKIFNIFQLLHDEDEYQGTGIGLAIVKKSVELMNEQVWVKSVGPRLIEALRR